MRNDATTDYLDFSHNDGLIVNSKLSLTRTGNLGVANTAPTEKLDVTGNVRFSGALMPNNTAGTSGQVLTSAGAGVVPTWTTPVSSNIYTADGTLAGNRIVTQGTNTLAFNSTATTGTSHFTVDGTTLNIDAVNNRVGIGTATPGVALDVVGSVLATVSGTTRSLKLEHGGSNLIIRPVTSGGSLTAIENTSGNIVMNPTSGNLGVANSAPTEKLDVTGNVRFSGALMPNNTAGTSGQVLTSAGAGAVPTWTTPTAANNIYTADGTLAGGLTTVTGVTGNFRTLTLGAGNGLSIAGDVTASILFKGPKLANWADFVINANADGGATVGTEHIMMQIRGNEYMRILDGGNVGINNTAPTEKLDVTGNIRFSGALMPNNTAGTSGQVLTSAGAGAVPTWTTPTASSSIYSADGTIAGNRLVTMNGNRLQIVSGDGTGNLAAWDGTSFTVGGNTSTASAVGLGFSTTNNHGWISSLTPNISWRDMYYRARDHVFFYGGTTEAFRVLNTNGFIGIGTSAPTSKLEVSGSATNTTAYNAGAGTSIDFSNSNIAYTSATATGITLTNIKNGGAYTLVFTSTTASGTPTFTASGFTFVSVATTARTTGKKHIYSFIVAGTEVYVTMGIEN